MNQFDRIRKYKDYILFSSKTTLFSRYSNMYLGVFWWFLDPILLMAVYSFVYLVIFGVETENYLSYIMIGIITWRWIVNSITHCTDSIASKIGILEQVNAPKQIFPLIDLLVETVLFLSGFILIFGALTINQIPFTWHIVEVIPVIMVTFVALYGIGLVVAHYGAFVADLKPAMVYVLRFIFYLSPIFYEVSRLPEELQKYYYLNPVTQIVFGLRNPLMYDQSPSYLALFVILLVGLGLILLGLRKIGKNEKNYCKLK
jgi:ABC-type polysaccharide/polyol phosphate export permease